VLLDFLRSIGSATGPISLASTTEELLGRKSSGSLRSYLEEKVVALV
jgi:hypothetical protein